MEDLCNEMTYSTGTVVSNRRGLPKEASQNNQMNRGEFIWLVKDEVGFVQWMDTKQVNVLSTAFHLSSLTTTKRYSKGWQEGGAPMS